MNISSGMLVSFKRWSPNEGGTASMWKHADATTNIELRRVAPDDLGIIVDAIPRFHSVDNRHYTFYLILVEHNVGFVEQRHLVFL